MKNKQLKDYSQYKGDLKGDTPMGTIAYLGYLPFQYETFSFNMLEMAIYNAKKFKKPIHYDVVRSSSQAVSRNVIAKQIIGDWVLMIDTDQTFDPDLAYRMIKVMNERKLHILTGAYIYKKKPYLPTIYFWDKKKNCYRSVEHWVTKKKKLDIFQCHAAGAGCLLVKRWVFDYIQQELNEDPFTIRKPFDNPKSDPLGEDLSFFDRCRQLDIQVICDPRITVGHLIPHSVEVGHEYDPHKVKP